MSGLGVTQSEPRPNRDETASNPPSPPAAPGALDRLRTERANRAAVAGAVTVVGIVAVVVPLLITRHYGALGIVRNDDWSYLITLFRWVDHGKLDFNNWVSMTLITQLVLAAPLVALFGHNITLIQLETAVFGLGGLLCVMWFGLAITRRIWIATFVAVTVAAGPLWGALAFSFMTDVPAFAVSMLACALGIRAFARERVSLPFLIASTTMGVVGFTIRQYAAVPAVAVVLVGGYLLIREGDRARLRAYVAALAVLLISAGIFWAAWRTVPHPKAFSPAMPSGHSIRATLYKGTGLVRLVGLLVMPALVLAGPLRIVRRSWAVARDSTVFAALGSVALLTFTATQAPRIAFAGNYISPDGILAQGVAYGHRPDILPRGFFTALLVLGSISTVLLTIAVVPLVHDLAGRRAHRDWALRDPVTALLGLVVAGYAVAYFAAAITDIPLYDRYVLPVVPVVAVLLLHPAPVPAPVTGGERASPRRLPVARALVVLAFLVGVGLVYTADSASFDGTRWHVAEAATHAGWSPNQVRGGFEWNNFYGGTRVAAGGLYCVQVVLDPRRPIPAARVVAKGYYRSPFKDPVPVVAVRTLRPCIPAGTKDGSASAPAR